MRVELALIDGDNLLGRAEVVIGLDLRVDTFSVFRATHILGREAAGIVLDNFDRRVALKNSDLHIPIHESNDWESIKLERYTLAFWCHLDA